MFARPNNQIDVLSPSEVSSTSKAYPFSHCRSNSTYVPTHSRPMSLKRTNSVRSSKDIIPLRLAIEQTSAPSPVVQDPTRSHSRFGHRRGFSVGVGKSEEAPRTTRPGSMFFGRLASPKEDEVLSSSSRSPTRESELASHRTTSLHSICLDSRTLDYFLPRNSSLAHNGSSSGLVRSRDCAVGHQKIEARLQARITNLETERDTKDLTIAMLSEQLGDKSQELELLKEKMLILENLLASEQPHLPPLTQQAVRGPSSCYSAYPGKSGPGRTTSSCYSADEGIGSSRASTTSRPTSSGSATDSFVPQFAAACISDTKVTDERRISLNSVDPDLSYDELVDENVMLKEEVSRLNNILEDGLGALSDLGL